MRTLCLFLTGLAAAATMVSRAADTGDQVVVVYNSRMPESRALAEHYAKRRNVPSGQIIGLSLPQSQDISRAEFQDLLQKPLAKMLEQKKLWHIGSEIIPAVNDKPSRVLWKVKESKIRYAVLCYGVPVRINSDPNRPEAADESIRPEMRRNEAAVDSELAVLPCIEQRLPLAGPLQNPLYGATNAAWFHPTNGVLMVARLDGPSAVTARDMVDKAIQAETDGLWGRAYFDLRNTADPNYKMGDNWLRAGAEICRKLGFETVVDESPETFRAEFPMSQIAFYFGWYDGNASGPFTRSQVEFMPGAFAYHLHSFSATDLRNATNYWIGPLLAKGATASVGYVYEPYLSGTMEVAVFVARFLFEGMSLGESAYAALPVLSWQTTIVGDPLYRPFAMSALQRHQELVTNHSQLVEWSHLRLVDLNLAKGNPARALAIYLEQTETTRHSAVLTEKLADLYEALGKPSSAVETCEQALKLDPSPQQRVRLRLTLAERLMALNRPQEAYDDYVSLLQEDKDYPNKLDIYKRILPLTQMLNKRKDAARYEELIHQLTPPPPPPETNR
jgi:uncharacterized protein (TIGR03790 family)